MESVSQHHFHINCILITDIVPGEVHKVLQGVMLGL